MYTGGVLLFLGGPLLLGSVFGLIGGALMIVILVVRIFGEERMLHQELAGYTAYAKQVRSRLIPFLF
jgi:protein-S-isoprenylcysteine O-methyltransferase Ste14